MSVIECYAGLRSTVNWLKFRYKAFQWLFCCFSAVYIYIARGKLWCGGWPCLPRQWTWPPCRWWRGWWWGLSSFVPWTSGEANRTRVREDGPVMCCSLLLAALHCVATGARQTSSKLQPTRILAQASCVDSVPRRSLMSMEPRYCGKPEGTWVRARVLLEQLKPRGVRRSEENIRWPRTRTTQRWVSPADGASSGRGRTAPPGWGAAGSGGALDAVPHRTPAKQNQWH